MSYNYLPEGFASPSWLLPASGGAKAASGEMRQSFGDDHMKIQPLALGIVLLLTSQAYAQAPATPAAPAKSPLLAQPGIYTIDPDHTQARFEWRHFGLSLTQGRFDKTAGKLTVDPAKRQASVDVTIDANSLSTGVPTLDSRLKSSAFFDVAKHPTISFRASDFQFEGEQLQSVRGELSVKGVTKPVVLKVNHAVCKDSRNPTMALPACGADLELTVKRSEFNLGALAPAVADDVNIRISVEAIKR